MSYETAESAEVAAVALHGTDIGFPDLSRWSVSPRRMWKTHQLLRNKVSTAGKEKGAVM